MTSRRRKKKYAHVSPWLVVLAVVAVTVVLAVVRRHSSSGSRQQKRTEASAEGRIPPGQDSAYASANGGVRIPGSMLTIVKAPAFLPSQMVDYTGFTVSFNPDNHTPNYAAWELLGSETEGSATRDDGDFWQDTGVKGCPESRDYSRSGFDRGHMVPAADQKWSVKAMRDCFSMANMCPQKHELNAGAWKTLEAKERLWAQRDSALVIVAGPIYNDSDKKRIGATGVRVPSAFFKVLLAPYADRPRAIGFVYPNMKAPGNMQDYAISVDEVERLTGLDFFSTLPDDIENEIEANFHFKTWNKK